MPNRPEPNPTAPPEHDAIDFTHPFPFDPTYGYALADLLAVEPEPGPADFDAFWRQTYEQARAIDLRLETRPSRFATDRFDVREVYYDSLPQQADAPPIRVGAWLATPRHATPTRGLVASHGYGGRDAPDLDPIHPGADEHTAVIFPCARGFNLSRQPGLPDSAAFHVLHAIDDRNTYIHRGCVADHWLAGSALLQLVPGLGETFDYCGESFGGGVGALATPWDPRVRRIHLNVPSFGPHPLRLSLMCSGSGEAVRAYAHRRGLDRTLEVLQYFDASTAALRIRQPTHVAAALFDPAVPPPGQFSIYNALRCHRRLAVLSAGHFQYAHQAEQETRLRADVLDWMTQNL